MPILYAFDEHKNRVAFNGEEIIPITISAVLPDGSILFYDRGDEYGEYKLGNNGYPERIDGAVDNGSAGSANWRYLICDKSDLDNTGCAWGASETTEGLTDIAIGVGLPNTDAMITKYENNDTYWWKSIKQKRDSTGLKWFMPSKDELNLMYENRAVITGQGGDAFNTNTAYWSSSEYNEYHAYYLTFSTGHQNATNKRSTYLCRLLRRI